MLIVDGTDTSPPPVDAGARAGADDDESAHACSDACAPDCADDRSAAGEVARIDASPASAIAQTSTRWRCAAGRTCGNARAVCNLHGAASADCAVCPAPRADAAPAQGCLAKTHLDELAERLLARLGETRADERAEQLRAEQLRADMLGCRIDLLRDAHAEAEGAARDGERFDRAMASVLAKRIAGLSKMVGARLDTLAEMIQAETVRANSNAIAETARADARAQMLSERIDSVGSAPVPETPQIKQLRLEREAQRLAKSIFGR